MNPTPLLLLALAWPAPCRLSSQDRAFLVDLGKRELVFFLEQADPHYGFVDAFNPNTGWVNPDVIGIDAGKWVVSYRGMEEGLRKVGLAQR